MIEGDSISGVEVASGVAGASGTEAGCSGVTDAAASPEIVEGICPAP